MKATPGGQAIADQYTAAEAARRRQAEEATLAALRHRRFVDAARAVYTFEADQVFPRDELMGASPARLRKWWATKDVADDLALLQEMWSGAPPMIARLPPNQQDILREAAAMRWLWDTRIGTWLPEDFTTGLAIDRDWLPNVVQNYAWHRREVKNLGAQRIVKEVEVGNCNDAGVCQACWALTGRRYRLDQVPDLPHPGCTSRTGCRCGIRAVLG